MIGGIVVGGLSGAILAYAPRQNRMTIQLVGMLALVAVCLGLVVAKIALLAAWLSGPCAAQVRLTLGIGTGSYDGGRTTSSSTIADTTSTTASTAKAISQARDGLRGAGVGPGSGAALRASGAGALTGLYPPRENAASRSWLEYARKAM